MNVLAWGIAIIGGIGYIYIRSQELQPEIEAVESESESEPTESPLFSSAENLLTEFGRELKTMFSLPKRAAPYVEDISSAENTYGLPDGLLGRLLYEESRFRADIITGLTTSSAGAQGIAQFMPATAKEMGIDPLDPSQAIPAAAKYLRRLYDSFGTWEKALAAYNWGYGNVKRKGIDNAPKETQNYVASILSDIITD